MCCGTELSRSKLLCGVDYWHVTVYCLVLRPIALHAVDMGDVDDVNSYRTGRDWNVGMVICYSYLNPPPSSALTFTASRSFASSSSNSPTHCVLAWSLRFPVSRSSVIQAIMLHPSSRQLHTRLLSVHLPKNGRYSLEPNDMQSVFIRRRTALKNAGSDVNRCAQIGCSSAISFRRTRQHGMRSVSMCLCRCIEILTTVVSGLCFAMVQR